MFYLLLEKLKFSNYDDRWETKIKRYITLMYKKSPEQNSERVLSDFTNYFNGAK